MTFTPWHDKWTRPIQDVEHFSLGRVSGRWDYSSGDCLWSNPGSVRRSRSASRRPRWRRCCCGEYRRRSKGRRKRGVEARSRTREKGQPTKTLFNANELRELRETGKVSGYEGHHMESVSGNPQVARDPNNIRFVNGRDAHLKEHGGNWRNRTPLRPRLK